MTPPPPKYTYKINLLKNPPFYVLWGLPETVTVTGVHLEITSATSTRSGRLPRLRRAAHKTSPAGSVPLPLSSVATLPRRIDPLWGLRPPLPPASAPPFGLAMGEAFWKRALAPAAQRQRTARSGGRFACESFDATATAQRAECLLRSTTRGPARSKAIRARHAEGVASGHSLASVRCRRRLKARCGRVNRVSGRWGYITLT